MTPGGKVVATMPRLMRSLPGDGTYVYLAAEPRSTWNGGGRFVYVKTTHPYGGAAVGACLWQRLGEVPSIPDVDVELTGCGDVIDFPVAEAAVKLCKLVRGKMEKLAIIRPQSVGAWITILAMSIKAEGIAFLRKDIAPCREWDTDAGEWTVYSELKQGGEEVDSLFRLQAAETTPKATESVA